ncbi:MAG: sigma-70 family RNA polymerase sigma factor [Anaerolineales bacterium]|jgi:RNA polymerase sigma-70 factor (ECF subfamily)|nr:sigma-70 family RNA polymerase sigma factor [Anaerolineales bacterium]
MRAASEQELLGRAQRFEEEALAEIFDRYHAGIYRYAMRLLGDEELARDCMSETFSRFLVALQRGAGPQEHLQAYLYRIAHNWVTDFYRKKTPPSVPLDDFIPDAGDDLHQIVAQNLEMQRVRDALTLLTPDQRQVIVLKYLEDWDHEEIAQAMNKPVGAVKALQHRAVEALRRLLT